MNKKIRAILLSINTKKINLIYFLITILLSFLFNNKKYFLGLYKPFEFLLEKKNGDLYAYIVAINHIKNGGNPYIDYLGKDIAQYNYPSFFAIFSYIPGFCLDNIYIITKIITGISILLILVIWKPIGFKNFVIFFIAILSPASILAFERGNSDLIIFSLIAISILVYKNKLASNSLILFAGFCKLFPIAALGNLLLFQKINRKNLILLVCASIFFLIYIILIWDQIRMISKNKPFDIYNFCYGFKEIPEIISDKFVKNKTLVYSIYLLATTSIFNLFLRYFNNSYQLQIIKTDFQFYSLILGSLIFCFSYVIGINWDYRKIFLFFTLPFLLKNHTIKNFKFAIIICILILWEQLFVRVLFPKEINYIYIITNNILILIYISFLNSVIYKAFLKNNLV